MTVAVRLRLLEFDLRSHQIPIGFNRKRGRPANTKNELQRQPGEENNDEGNNDAEIEPPPKKTRDRPRKP